MYATRKGLIVAASVGAVEGLKDQGLCRWNNTLRSVHHCTKNNMKEPCSSDSAMFSSSCEKAEQYEDSMRKVMYLSCWGSN